MTYAIEDDIPLPTRVFVRREAKLTATLRALKMRQSALMEDKKRGTIMQAARQIGREIGGKFIIHPEGIGFRVFRVEGEYAPPRKRAPGGGRKSLLQAAE